MVYSEKIVACIKAGGQILRETDGLVSLPFGSEYSILVKNLHAVRLQIKVSVDGQDATEGTRLIVPPNSDLELERFIRGGNMYAGNRFKFIERTAEIEQHRGIKVDDGIVRIEAWVEQIQPFAAAITYYEPYWPNPWPQPRYPRDRRRQPRWGRGMTRSTPMPMASGGHSTTASGTSGTITHGSTVSAFNCSVTPTSDQGITVPGSASNQQFHSASGFLLEPQSKVLILRLRGAVGGAAVVAPVTVAVKPTCSTCGRVNRATNRFCSQCGTALVLI